MRVLFRPEARDDVIKRATGTKAERSDWAGNSSVRLKQLSLSYNAILKDFRLSLAIIGARCSDAFLTFSSTNGRASIWLCWPASITDVTVGF